MKLFTTLIRLTYRALNKISVSNKTDFYINQDGKTVIVLQKHEIAPGAAGQQEFEINEAADERENNVSGEVAATDVATAGSERRISLFCGANIWWFFAGIFDGFPWWKKHIQGGNG